MTTATDFDQYAESYDDALSSALAASGEDREYFARGRVLWLAECLRWMNETPSAVMDYGCGTGSTTPLMREILGAQTAVGVDVSLRSLEMARKNQAREEIRFLSVRQYAPRQALDLAYCNGVFHHIPPQGRRQALQYIYDSLRPGGLFAFWENNPWNPATRYVMAHCAFDNHASTLNAPQAKQFLRAGGFEILRTDFLFIFPRILRWLRGIERLASRLPLGAQYQVLCRKPMNAESSRPTSLRGAAS